jgi:hypothetical protein
MQYMRLPQAVLATLADRCGQLGEPGISALRETGRVAGTLLFDGLGTGAEDLDKDDFWSALDARIRQLHLGFVHFEPLDRGLAVLAWHEMPETGAEGSAPRITSGCHLATGLLGGLLGRAAGQPIAVLEVACGADGSEPCWFLIGSESRLTAIHDRLARGEDLRAALGR